MVRNISATDERIRKLAQSEALTKGPPVVESLRGVESPEAEEIVNNYDGLIQALDKQRAFEAVKYFPKRCAARFLAGCLKEIRNPDVKLECVRQLRGFDVNSVKSELSPLIDALESEDIYMSGSESATLHSLYIEELIELISAIIEEGVSAEQPLDRKVQNILRRAKQRLDNKQAK